MTADYAADLSALTITIWLPPISISLLDERASGGTDPLGDPRRGGREAENVPPGAVYTYSALPHMATGHGAHALIIIDGLTLVRTIRAPCGAAPAGRRDAGIAD